MGFPQSYAGAVSSILSGRHTASTTPQQLGVNVPCRRILLTVDAGGVAYVVAQGQPVTSGFPIPQVQVDGNFTPLELWVNNVEVIWIVGAAGSEVVNWLAEIV